MENNSKNQIEQLYATMESQRIFRKSQRRETNGTQVFDIGVRFHPACLSHWQMDDRVKLSVLTWIQKPFNMIVFLGSAGVGKTYLCSSLLNYFWESGYEVYYITGRKFFQKIQSAISENKNQYSEIKKLAEQDILIFDDLGSSTNTPWQKEMILDLVDLRYESKKPTVFTSNLSQERIKSEMDFRTHDRMINSKGNIIIEKWDKSLRPELD